MRFRMHHRPAYRALIPLIALAVMFVGLLPAGAAESGGNNNDQDIEAENAAPVLSGVSINASTAGVSTADVWTPNSSDVTLTFTVHDDNTLLGTTYSICFYLSTQDCTDDADAWGIAKFTAKFTSATGMWLSATPGVAGTNGTWGKLRSIAVLSGSRDQTEAQIAVRVRVGQIARATRVSASNSNDAYWAVRTSTVDPHWNVQLTATDSSAATDTETSEDAEVVQYVRMCTNQSMNGCGGALEAKNFGVVATTATSGQQSQTFTGIKSNDDWEFQVRMSAGRLSGRAGVLLDNDGSPGLNRFSARFIADAGDATSAGQWLSTGYRDVTRLDDSEGYPLEVDAPVQRTINYAFTFGYVPAGNYKGTVGFRLINSDDLS